MSAKAIPMGLFQLGNLVATPNALRSLTHEEMIVALRRHQSGDWGDLTDTDKAENNTAMVEGCRILSLYHTNNGTKFWMITEADRSRTTVLLPEDY
jgi:hypothetical protein